MKSIAKYILCIAAAAAATGMQARNTRSGYFVEDYTYRFQLNPAFGNSRGFVSMPALGNLNVGMNGNLHMKDVLYNIDGRTATFLHPGVSAAEVLANLSDMNTLRANVKVDVLSVGFKAFGGFNTINIGARVDAGANLPKAIFSLLKEGVANRDYQIDNLRANATAYAQLAFGHSRDINGKLRIGGAFKVLLGGATVDADLRRATLSLGRDAWTITTEADINASVKGLTYDTKENSHSGRRYVSGAKVENTGLNGWGLGLDLGAIYKPARDWTVSLSLLDFGFISWNNNMVASTNGEKTFNTDRYTFNPDDKADNSFKNEWEVMRDDLTALYELDNMGDRGGRAKMLAATLNVGAEYTLPVYRKLSFGLLNTTRIHPNYSWTEFRLSANIAPVKVLDASVNLAAGTFGCGFGWLLNLHCPGFNLFLGMDHTLGKMSKQFVPLSSNGSVNFGLNFLF